MRPRVVYRTHYQVAEPTYALAVVRNAASATTGQYREALIQKAISEFKRLRIGLNPAAAAYAVDLAVHLDLLSDKGTWTDLGLVAGLVGDNDVSAADPFELSPVYAALVLRMFIEADGAALTFLLRRAHVDGVIRAGGEDSNRLAREMFVAILRDYIEITTDAAERLRMRREVDSLEQHGFSGHTGVHKLLLHLQTLYRVGLLQRSDTSSREFLPAENQGSAAGLLEIAGSPRALEKLIRDGDLIYHAASCMGLGCEGGPAPHFDEVRRLYTEAIAVGISICPLQPLVELVQLSQLREGRRISRATIMSVLATHKAGDPRSIRYHVDRLGRVAFVRIQ